MGYVFTQLGGTLVSGGRHVRLRRGAPVPPPDRQEDLDRLIAAGAVRPVGDGDVGGTSAPAPNPVSHGEEPHAADEWGLLPWLDAERRTIAAIMERVGDNPGAARVALAWEQSAEHPRVSLVRALQGVVDAAV